MHFTTFEKKFLNILVTRDVLNLGTIFSIILVLGSIFLSRDIHWGILKCLVVFFYLPVLTFLVTTYCKNWILRIEKIFFYKTGRWYCPGCDFPHKRKQSDFVSCNRPVQNIMDNKEKCALAEQNQFLKESFRVFKYNAILWKFWKFPVYGDVLKKEDIA